ncbi:MAG TPA: TetR/AcrR family transcriptional regulator [Mycobacterium sp.]|jgi:TetR/AcrR family transcriptional regulator, transcriptional repressor for nem operon|nr:TetR/AcrR family transcriptional regulator [Mycobacterium sp.]
MARPRKFDEAEVVQAARDQFWLHGYNGTSLDDLTVVTGLGRGSLYGAFTDKRTLFLRAIDDYATVMTDQVFADLRDPEKKGRDRLVDHIRLITKILTADTNGRGCLMAKSAAEIGATDKEVARRIRKWLDRYQRDIAEAIQAAQRDGDIDPDADPDELALLILALLRGAEALRKGGMPPRAIAAVAEQGIALLPRRQAA